MKVPPTRLRRVLSIVRTAVYYLKILGLAPFSVGTKTFQFSKAGLSYNVVISILVTISAAAGVQSGLHTSFQSNSTLSQIFATAQMIARAFTTCIIVILWTVKQKSAVHILNRLLEIEVQISGLKKRPSDKKMIMFLTLHLIVNGVIWIGFWTTGLDKVGSSLLLFWRIITCHVVYWFCIEYVIAISLIARGLETVNENLSILNESRSRASCAKVGNDTSQPFSLQAHSSRLSTLKSLIRIRVKLSEVSQDVEDFFSFAILCCTIPAFLTVLRASYRFVTAPEKPISFLVRHTVWVCLNVFPITLLAVKATKVATQGKSTAQIVRKLLTSPVARDIVTELEEFTLELLHDNFVFTAYGLFTIDLTLLTSIFGATMTYLVVSLQLGSSAS